MKLGETFEEAKTDLIYKFSSFLSGPSEFGDGIILLKDLRNELDNPDFRTEVVTNPAWGRATENCISSMEQMQQNDTALWKQKNVETVEPLKNKT